MPTIKISDIYLQKFYFQHWSNRNVQKFQMVSQYHKFVLCRECSYDYKMECQLKGACEE